MPLSKEEIAELSSIIVKRKIRSHKGWNNFTKNLSYPDAIVLDVEDKETLSDILSKIDELNQHKSMVDRIIVRVVAGRGKEEYAESYTFTPEAEGDVIIRLTGQSFREIKRTDNERIMELGGSIQIGEADRYLYDTFQLSLPTSSLIPYVTVAGLAANAGHGTGKDQPSFSGLIKAMTICLPNGKVVRIDKTHPDFYLIRSAHMGLFGVVLSVEMECVPAKKMHCIMDVSTVPDFIDKVKSGLFNKYPYVSVMYVPTYQKNERNSHKHPNVIIYSWEPVDIDTPDYNSCPELSHLSQRIQIKLEKGLNVTDLMREHPHLIPYFTRYIVSSVAIGKEDKESVSPWYNMHYQTAFPRDIDDADYLFQVSDNHQEIIAAFEKIVTTLTEYAKDKSYPVLDAVYLRFFQGTNAGLSTSAHQDGMKVCGLDIVSSKGIKGYKQFKQEMADYFIHGELQSKPHWGKFVPLDVDYSKMYGDQYEKFKDALARWYSENDLSLEKSMFLNRFHCDVLNLPYKPYLKQTYQKKTKHSGYVNTTETAHALCELVSTETKEGEKLIKCLHMIDHPDVSVSGNSIFSPSKPNHDEETLEDQKHCCVIL